MTATRAYASTYRSAATIRPARDDYAWCPERDAEHDPRPATVHDRDMPAGYFTVECAACGQTTGYPMPDPEEITWD